MNRIDFTKMVASGNDFVVLETKSQAAAIAKPGDLAKQICDRKFGIGADGMLLLEPKSYAAAAKADIRMRIFNPDGNEVDMCGNGARCCARYFSFQLSSVSNQPIKIETKAGILEAFVSGDMVKLKMFDPRSISLNFQLVVAPRNFGTRNDELIANYINTGVPHVVIFVEDLKNTDVITLGRQIRYHKKFAPQGTNADFVEVLGKDDIAVRTYERGVEDETLACGTGCVAGALIYTLDADTGKSQQKNHHSVSVHTKSGEILKVCFDKKGQKFTNVFLEGSAKIVYKGSLAAAREMVPRDSME